MVSEMAASHGGEGAGRHIHAVQCAVRVEQVPLSLKAALRTLLTDYLVEFAERGGEQPPARDADGHVVYRWFDDYWTDQARTPLGIWLDDALVGFCLLRDTSTTWSIAEFYVEPSSRCRGVGAAAVEAVKAICRDRGQYDRLLAGTLRWNTTVLSFWHRQGFETVAEEPQRLINLFWLDGRLDG
jgi:predicted acetyltransferase